MKNRIFLKLLLAFVPVILVTAFALDTALRKAWENTLREEIGRNLTQKTLMFAHRVETDQTHSLADIAAQEGQAAGARATIIDPAGKVVYNGAIDDKRSTDLADVKTAKNYVVAALEEMKAGKPVSTPSTTPYGCSIKYD